VQLASEAENTALSPVAINTNGEKIMPVPWLASKLNPEWLASLHGGDCPLKKPDAIVEPIELSPDIYMLIQHAPLASGRC